jgi:multimeric flavodoxin WrbA
MDYVILNGMNENDSFIHEINDTIVEKLTKQDLQGESVHLYDKDIKPCLGCFKCWVETPGICVIDDYGRESAKKMIQSEYMFYLTPIRYGGYSAELKKALDRSLPLLSPFFRVFHEEIHHEQRYDKYPNMIVYGILDEPNEEQEEIFTELTKRNSLNNFAEKYSCQIIYKTDEKQIILEKIQNGLSIVGDEND